MTFEDELRKASHAELVRLCAAEASLRKRLEEALGGIGEGTRSGDCPLTLGEIDFIVRDALEA